MDFFETLDPSLRRDTTVNWPGLVQRVVDDYRQLTTLPHGVQKDAIQNAWDARRKRRGGPEWSCTFRLSRRKSGSLYLSVTDTGTHGLTGGVLLPSDYYADLPQIERWARFESLAFTHPEGTASGHLGARGQGKFIFVGASSRRRILYDTLRPDGTYRLGVRVVEQTSSPVYHWEGQDAVRELKAYDPALEPLTEIGTRVLIDEPQDEIVQALLSGQFLRHIEETWWPIIQRYEAKIAVANAVGEDTETATARVPADVVLPEVDNKTHDVWIKERRALEYEGSRFTIKRLHVARVRTASVQEDVRGVSLYRGGMKVMVLPMRHVPAAISSSIVGHVEFDERLDEEMKALESPTHYSFDLSRGIGRKVRLLIEDELAKFAQEKLGQGADVRAVEAERRREAERKALAAINRAARDLGIVALRGAGGGQGGGGGGTPAGPFSVSLASIELPTDSRRVNYGDRIGGINAVLSNRLPAEARLRVRIWLTTGDTTVAELGLAEVKVPPAGDLVGCAGGELGLDANEHQPGEYAVRASAALLDGIAGHPKGLQAKATFRFWLEVDPPERGIFESIEALGYPDASRIDAEVVAGDAGGWKFQYNVNHPAKRREDQSEDDLFDYLFRLMARELIYIDARSEHPTQFAADDISEPERILRRAAEIVSSISYAYYQ